MAQAASVQSGGVAECQGRTGKDEENLAVGLHVHCQSTVGAVRWPFCDPIPMNPTLG